MINIHYLDVDNEDYYKDLKNWIPPYCQLIKCSKDLLNPGSFQHFDTDIMLINPEIPGINEHIICSYLGKRSDFPIIFLSDKICLPKVVSYLKKGAYSYIQLKKDKKNLVESIIKAISIKNDDCSNCDEKLSSVDHIIGSSKRTKRLKNDIIRYKGNCINVHIVGESGTGKELTAQALHNQNYNSDKTMITINCGAIPENLIESELFGTCQGAYTDSIDKIGLFEQANGSTVFLDEVAELSMSAQVKILRIIENGTFTRVGENMERHTKFNLISATNKDLKKEVLEGRFREDLYYRLTSLIISIPPLRERKEDILELSDFFLGQTKKGRTLTETALLKLLNHTWPGNIRELKNALIRGAYYAGEEILIDDHHILFY